MRINLLSHVLLYDPLNRPLPFGSPYVLFPSGLDCQVQFYTSLSSKLCTNPLPEMHIRVGTFWMDRMAACSAIYSITSRRTAPYVGRYTGSKLLTLIKQKYSQPNEHEVLQTTGTNKWKYSSPYPFLTISSILSWIKVVLILVFQKSPNN